MEGIMCKKKYRDDDYSLEAREYRLDRLGCWLLIMVFVITILLCVIIHFVYRGN